MTNFKHETIDMKSESTWWKRRSKIEKRLLVLFSISVLIIVSLVIALNSGKSPPCTSKECIQLSNSLLKSMDVEANPCEDFHHFACGDLMKNIKAKKNDVVPVYEANSREVREQIRSIVERPIEPKEAKHLIAVKNFYRACMNETAIEFESLNRLKGILRDLGGWPLMDGNSWREEGFDWRHSIHKLRKIGYDFDLLLPITVDIDVRAGNRFIVYIDTPDVKYHQEKLKTNYFSYMIDIASMMGLRSHIQKRELKDVHDFELQLLRIWPAKTYLGMDYQKFTITELQEEFPSMPWFEFINGIIYPSAKVTTAEEVIVTNLPYLRNLFNLIENTPKRVIANFIAWNVIHHLVIFLSKEYKTIAYHYGIWNNEIHLRNEDWENCINIVGTRMKLPVLNSYLDEYPTRSSREYIKSIAEIIKIQYQNTIRSTDWMDRVTREFSLGKLSQMKIHIGAPDKLYDDDLLSDIYDPVEIHEDKYLASVLNIDFLNANLRYEKLHHQVEGYLWTEQVLPFNIYAKYIPEKNTLLINSAFLAHGLIDKQLPGYFNYAVGGTIMAKEMGRFLTDGMFFTVNGVYQEWPSEDYFSQFLTKENCLHSKYRATEIPREVEVKAAEYPVMADYLGIRTAYGAYQSYTNLHKGEHSVAGLDFTPNELFWILYAFGTCSNGPSNETFYPNIDERRLVNVPLSSMAQFAEDFVCRTNTPMDPESKCHL